MLLLASSVYVICDLHVRNPELHEVSLLVHLVQDSQLGSLWHLVQPLCQFDSSILWSIVWERRNWEPVDPVVADPAAQYNDKRNNILINEPCIYMFICMHIYIHIYLYTHGNALSNTQREGTKLPNIPWLVVLLSKWVPNSWVYRFPNKKTPKNTRR